MSEAARAGSEGGNDAPLEASRVPNPNEAFGLAVIALSGVPPFSEYDFGAFGQQLFGQIHRGHYLFAVRGDRVLGYVGWGLCEEATARAWLEGERRLSSDDCAGGACVLVMTFLAAAPEVTRFLARECRVAYPDRKVVFAREYTDGRERRIGAVFNRRWP